MYLTVIKHHVVGDSLQFGITKPDNLIKSTQVQPKTSKVALFNMHSFFETAILKKYLRMNTFSSKSASLYKCENAVNM